MKTTEELKVWFWKIFNNCYCVVHKDHPSSLFMFYDEKFIRQMKLCKLSGDELICPKKLGVCLFEQDYKNGYFYMNYDEISLFLYKNYTNSWFEVKRLVNSWLKESYNTSSLKCTLKSMSNETSTDKLSTLTTTLTSMIIWEPIIFELKENDKLNTLAQMFYQLDILKETDNISTLTSFNISNILSQRLKESDKLSTLTAKVFSSNIGPIVPEF